MTISDAVRLISLAAIWGASFIFLRILSPAIGIVATADLRLLIGGLALVLYFSISRKNFEWKKYWKLYLVVGLINSAIPFLFYAYAALYIPASYSVILNTSAPLFGTLFATIWLAERFTVQRFLGLTIGALGVFYMSWEGPIELTLKVLLSILACIAATVCYGLGGVYIKKFAAEVQTTALAACSQLLAGIVLIPVNFMTTTHYTFTPFIIINILALAILCSSVAYVLYYKLIANIGPAKALTVTLLMPIFGMLWGNIFLSEEITFPMMMGTGLILGGTLLVVKK